MGTTGKHGLFLSACFVALASVALAPRTGLAATQTVPLSQTPLDSRSLVLPNILFVLDDSGSMDSELLLTNANDGALWWDGALQSDGTGQSFLETLNGALVPNFNCVGQQGTGSYRDLTQQLPLCQPGANLSQSTTWFKYGYLFPNGVRGSNNGGYYNRTQTEIFNPTAARAGIYAVPPPIPQLSDGTDAGFMQNAVYAAMRSADYNPIYYNPSSSYKPWQPYYDGGRTVTFSDAVPTAALSHPIFSAAGSGIDLTSNTSFYSQADGWTFRFLPGMRIPVGSVNGAEVYGRCTVISGAASTACTAAAGFVKLSGLAGLSAGTPYTVASNEYWDVEIAYYPATYYQKVTSCAPIQTAGGRSGCARPPACSSPAICYQAYDGNWLLETRITDAQGLQNFANWFQYYRKHNLLLAAAMGNVLTPVTTLRSGVVPMNARPSSVTVYDLSTTSPATNVQALLSPIYRNAANGGTPTRAALNFIGQQYMQNANLIQYACQVNAAMVLTDGFAVADTSVTPPSYAASAWEWGSPYTTITPHSLADIASSYYTNNLNPTFATGQVPTDPTAQASSADHNTNLHMVTYGFTLGTPGLVFGQPAYQAFNQNPYGNWPSPYNDWPTPSIDRNPSAIDDLWHATINARGRMFMANDAAGTTAVLESAITDVLVKSASLGAVTSSQIFPTAGTLAFRSSYNANAWFGDVTAHPIDNTGAVNTTSTVWSAGARLDKTPAASRLIVTYDPASATTYSFDSSSLPSAVLRTLNSSSSSGDAASVVNWLRGDRSLEGTTYRTRIHVLGDIVDAQPQYVQGANINGVAPSYVDNGYIAFKQQLANAAPVVYQAANDGMLHAFDATGDSTGGRELWAYIPSFVVPALKNLAQKSYAHQFYVDATPIIGDVDFCNTSQYKCAPSWRRILVGGLAAGGRGFYALDITQGATASTTTDVAQKFLWEFPNASTPSSVAAQVGDSFGRPVIAKTAAYGWVVLLTSGYFDANATPTSNGHLFVLDAATGALIANLSTTGGPSLAQLVAAVIAPSNPTISRVYGGDLDGNLWRFDLSSANPGTSPWTTTLITTLVDASGASQPITAAPQVGQINGSPVVFVGTGRLLSASDPSGISGNTFYAVMDDTRSMPIPALRSNLTRHTLSSSGGVTSVNTVTMDWTRYRGWYVDVSSGSGERFLSQAQLIQGVVYAVSNTPSGTPCSSASNLYAFDYQSGNELPASRFPGAQPWVQLPIGMTLASLPTVVQLASGQLVGLIHRADNSVDSVDLPAPPPNVLGKAAWREVVH